MDPPMGPVAGTGGPPLSIRVDASGNQEPSNDTRARVSSVTGGKWVTPQSFGRLLVSRQVYLKVIFVIMGVTMINQQYIN